MLRQQLMEELRETIDVGNMKLGILLGDPTKIKCTMTYIKDTGGRLDNRR